jgi:glutathione S-transferase
MTLQLYTVSGSPSGWKVQLALAHKRVPADVSFVSADAGDLKAAWFRAMNPRGKAPVLVDGEFMLYESDAIVDYLEDAYPSSGLPLWPDAPRPRAVSRRIALEASAYLYPPIRALVVDRPVEAGSPLVDGARTAIMAELDRFAARLEGQFFTGPDVGAADFAIYPLVALIKRLQGRRPEEGLDDLLPGSIRRWMGRIESMTGFAATWPPHWRS